MKSDFASPIVSIVYFVLFVESKMPRELFNHIRSPNIKKLFKSIRDPNIISTLDLE